MSGMPSFAESLEDEKSNVSSEGKIKLNDFASPHLRELPIMAAERRPRRDSKVPGRYAWRETEDERPVKAAKASEDGPGARGKGGQEEVVSAPTFYPSEEDMGRPIEYLRHVAKEAGWAGIAKVVPPNKWSPASRSPQGEMPERSFDAVRESVHRLGSDGTPSSTGARYTIASLLEEARGTHERFLEERGDAMRARVEEMAARLERARPLPDDGLSVWEHAEAEALEEELWSVIEGREHEWNVDWAPALDSKEVGSGFAVMGGGLRHPLDLSRLGEDRANLLSHLADEGVAGITRTDVEVGSTLATATWGQSDHSLMRVHYIHCGCSKTWYSCSTDSAESALSKLAEEGVHMRRPARLALSAGSGCTKVVQQPGAFIVCAPGALVTSFCHGPLFAESASVGSPEWLQEGRRAMERQRAGVPGARAEMFAHDKLVVRCAESVLDEQQGAKRRHHGSAEEAKRRWEFLERLVSEVKQMVEEQFAQRRRLEQKNRLPRLGSEGVSDPSRSGPCSHCGAWSHLTVVRCKQHPDLFLCPEHAGKGCKCSTKFILCRIDDDGLSLLLSRLSHLLDNRSGKASSGSQPRRPAG